MRAGVDSPVVAITGGTRGIGFAIAELFHGRGHRVTVCSRSARPATLPSEVVHCRADVRRKDDVERFVAATVAAFGCLDVFVNNAGISRWRPLGDLDEAFVSEIIETSVFGTLWGCAAAAPALADGGSLVMVSSLAGKRGSANNSAYCAAKFAVNGVTQSLAKELGPRGIRVNAVCPVYVETDAIAAALQDRRSPTGGRPVDEYLAEFSRTQTALGRLPTAREVAEAVYFLASPAASAITGQCLNVDCGVLPQ
jgi:3-oxoacyl-[acyl-carrier protein] reductase/meso-butanediol dehydrogenase/(S,S)-butanediol dehydrogenase/diacetyl reductase